LNPFGTNIEVLIDRFFMAPGWKRCNYFAVIPDGYFEEIICGRMSHQKFAVQANALCHVLEFFFMS
jgi:hypothetical protein